MRYVVYRVLYGEDFIQESIRSIYDYVDKIFIFWTDKPWGNITECQYLGETVYFPQKFDNVLGKIEELNLPNIIVQHDHVENNWNQFSHLVNRIILSGYEKPETAMFMEPDYVWRKDQLEQAFVEWEDIRERHQHATSDEIELWKTPYYRAEPNPTCRIRLACMFWDMRKKDRIPNTRRHANMTIPAKTPRLKAFVHNFGFCISDKAMYWKHMTALGFSQKIGDSPPIERWYQDKWKDWHPLKNNKNLAISKKYAHHIPSAIPYAVKGLPEVIREKYNI